MPFFKRRTLSSDRLIGNKISNWAASAALALCSISLAVATDPAHAGPRDYAIIIGNKTYSEESGIPPVKFADNDAEEFKRTAMKVFGVPALNISVINNATEAKLNRQFGKRNWQTGRIADKLSSDSTLYVYYSGHGMPAKDADGTSKAYLLNRESDASDPINTGYPLDALITRLKNIKTNVLQEGKVILIVEACFSGSTGEGKPLVSGTSASGVEGVEFDVDVEEEAHSDDIVIITASQGSQYANWDMQEKFGMFTDILLNGVWGGADGYTAKGADGNKDGELTLGELEHFVQRHMNRRLKLRFGDTRKQTPTFRGPRDTVIARFGASPFVRDEQRQYDELEKCARLAATGKDIDAINAFRKDCQYCDKSCSAKLDKRVSSLRQQIVACNSSDRRWGEISKSRDLHRVRFFVERNQCDKYKVHAQRLLDRLEHACDTEGKLLKAAVGAGDVRELKKLSESAYCAIVKKEATDSYSIYDRACKTAKTEFDKLKDTGSVAELNNFAKRTQCPRYQRRAERLAEKQRQFCRKDTLKWTRLKFSTDPRPLRKLAASTKCNSIRRNARTLVANLEEVCTDAKATYESIREKNDIEGMRQFADTTSCTPIKDEATKEVGRMSCKADGEKFASLRESGDTASLKDFIDDAACVSVKADAEKHLIKLNCDADKRELSTLERARDLDGLKKLADRKATCKPVRTAALRMLAPLDNESKERGTKPFRDCKDCPEIQPLRAACYWMGSTRRQGSYANERPARAVTLRNRFGIGVREVTVGEWKACQLDGACGEIGNSVMGKINEPITGVSWRDAQTYTKWLSRKTGKKYRLPTEAEWEYAARAGTTTKYAFGERLGKTTARFGLRRKGTVTDAGSYEANDFGLYDMHGNAAELVADCYENSLAGYPKNGSRRSKCRNRNAVTVRGGSYRDPASKVRSAVRTSIRKDRRRAFVGFRVARTFTTGGEASALVCPTRP